MTIARSGGWTVVAAALACTCVAAPPSNWSDLVRIALDRSLEDESIRKAVHGGDLVATSRGCRDEVGQSGVVQPNELPLTVSGLRLRRLESMREEEWTLPSSFSFLRVCAASLNNDPYVFVTVITYTPRSDNGMSLGLSGLKFRFERSWGRWRIAATQMWAS